MPAACVHEKIESKANYKGGSTIYTTIMVEQCAYMLGLGLKLVWFEQKHCFPII